MPNFYGVRASEEPTSTASPIVATSGVTIAFGTAPVQQVDGTANEIVLANSYDEAVAALGYSDDWKKYTLCEVMYSHFKLYGVAPLLLVNVLDPTKHKAPVTAATFTIQNKQVSLTGDAIASSIKVTGGEDNEEFTAGEDYDVFYSDGACIVEVLTGGKIATSNLTQVKVAYDAISFTADAMTTDLIGGYNVTTGKSTGLELVDLAYFKTKTLPSIIIAPGFSQMPTVAAVMAAKAASFSTVFKARCLCDIDTAEYKTYLTAGNYKESAPSFQNVKQNPCWPMVALEGRTFHLSTQIAGQMCKMDIENDGIPSKSASNQSLMADSAVLKDGTEVLLDLTQANYLRGQGIITAYNFVNGFTSWGTYTGAYPNTTDPKDMFTNISRMFDYVANAVVLTYWSRVDENLTPRYAESITDELNMWLNGLVSSGDLLGARCEIKSEENPVQDLMAGIVRIHIYMTPPSPAQEIDYLLEYDVDYVSSVLGVSE